MVYKKLFHLALQVGLYSVLEIAWVFVFYENVEFVAAVLRVVPVFISSWKFQPLFDKTKVFKQLLAFALDFSDFF